MPDSVVSIARITDPTTNPLSSGTLSRLIDSLAYAAFSAQANALVVARQISVPAIDDATTDLPALQTKLREHAAYVLQTLIPSTLHSFTDASGAVNLFTSMRSSIQTTLTASDALSQAAQLVGAVAEQFESNAENAGESADVWTGEADALSTLVAALKTAVARSIAALDGKDGLLKTTEAAIEEVREALAADIDAAVKSGKQIGDGIKTLLTGVITNISGLFSGGGDDKTKPDPTGKDKTKSDPKGDDSDPAGAKKIKTDAKPAKAAGGAGDGIDTVPIQGIGAIEEGAEKAGKIAANFQAHYAKLAALYQTLAEAKAALALTRALQTQADLLAGAVKETANAATSIQGNWTAIATGFRDYARDISAPDGVNPTILLATVNAAYAQGWSRVSSRVRPIEDAFTGIGNAIPPGGALT